MKAVILAAGEGRRLAPMGWDKPKCLLPYRGGTLLDHTLDAIHHCGIREVVIVVGYRRESVEETARRHSVKCEFVVNRDYAITNTMHSLWLARDSLAAGILYFNGDVWFERPLLSLLLEQSGSALAVDVKQCGEEEVKVAVDASRRITQIGKDLPPDKAFGEFIGAAKLDPSACGALVQELKRHDEELGRKNGFFEEALDAILVRQEIMMAPLGGFKAIEIDTPEDYARAKALWMS